VAALLGQVLRAARRWPEAIACFEQALVRDPADPEPLIAIGQLHRFLGDAEASRSCFEHAVLLGSWIVAASPGNAGALADLGLAYAELDDPDQAIEALRAALVLDPAWPEALQRLGVLLVKLGRLSEAEACFAALEAANPGDLQALGQRAMACQASGRLEECLARLEAGRAIAPADWNLTYGLLFACSTGGEALLPRLRQTASEHWQRLRASLPRAQVPLPLSLPHRPLRVGLLTAELGDHAVGYFLESFLRHHDRRQLQVELIETQPRPEPRSAALRALAADSFLLPERDRNEARRRIQERHYEVIMETSGFTSASGLDLLASRLAPVQCHYIGFHATTGLDTIDWFVADAHLVPAELESQFSERIWRLERPWAAYTFPQHPPAAASALGEEPPIFGSFNQVAKICRETLLFWAEALRHSPGARLLIKDKRTADPAVQQRITAFLASEGIEEERLHYEAYAASWQAHMAVYNRVDVALDATPWSSATTAFEALAMGVPLVAIRGTTLASRMSTAVLAGLGEPGWIAESPEQFARIAAGLLADWPALRTGKERLRQRALASSLFDGADLAQQLGRALQGMVEVTDQHRRDG
jgi:predicted O-linked N-acetylglucosamine transferase (SPINDLY family)